jgi:hypothetical protein
MAKVRQTAALRDVGEFLRSGSSAGISDRELLARFLDRDGESSDLAFAALVERHGPMVQRVCRAILREANAADDALALSGGAPRGVVLEVDRHSAAPARTRSRRGYP